MPPSSNSQLGEYRDLFENPSTADENVELLDLDLSDDKLEKVLINELELDIEYWNQKPWELKSTDVENVSFFLGDQLDQKEFIRGDSQYVDNRLFAATRAILSYATGKLATPEITPSRSDDKYLKMARAIQTALYQHSLDERVDQKFRTAVLNLITRKRGYLKQRYDPNAGLYGDIITEVCNPEDIIVGRHAKFMDNPNKIYHRLRGTVEELCNKFPEKEAKIKAAYSIQKGVYTQMSRMVTYYECWFSYNDSKGLPREAVVWFINEPKLILDKIPNPNWVYTGDDNKDKQQNVTTHPPKPFTWFNYLNMGRSFIDETSLFDQAKPQQRMLNKRGRQLMENADYVNGRWIASKKAMSEEDAAKFVNKNPKTVALVNSDDVGKSIINESAEALPAYVVESLNDLRNEIDTMMGTPAVFRGEQPSSQDTLGRDLMVKQQAGALQDDLVRIIQNAYADYYKLKLQLMRTYYTDDYWFQVKGGDGKFDFVMLNGDNIDSNVKISVEVDSTLPLDKANIRATAMELAKSDRIDNLTLFEDLGLPDPEIRTERLIRSQLDPVGYMNSVEQQLDNNNAEVDIMLLTEGKTPPERDNYDENYLAYFNNYLTKNEFAALDPKAKSRIVAYLMVVQHLAQESANLQAAALDDAGMSTAPIAPPAPRKTEQIQIKGQMDPNQTTAELNGAPIPPPAQAAPQLPIQQ